MGVVADFRIQIKASVPALNLSSAEKKKQELTDFMARKGWSYTELHIKGGISK